MVNLFNVDNSIVAGFFHECILPEEGAKLAGYTALISAYQLEVPLPDNLSAIGQKHKSYTKNKWVVYGPRYRPKDTLFSHLTFALKHEGVNLSVLISLFKKVRSEQIEETIFSDPNSIYSRKIWFLYEWTLGQKLNIPDIKDTKLRYTDILDSKLQYPGPSRRLTRQRVINNLPGSPKFCPLIRKTKILDQYISKNLNNRAESSLKTIHPDLLSRAAAFLLLEDSKASYTIEGESPSYDRAQRWGKAIGQAGKYPLSHDEFLRLQEIVISDFRYVQPGYRIEGGFIGQHDRGSMTPIPIHISAKHQDIYNLMEGLIETDNLLANSDYNAVLASAIIAFGFAFIHPLEDGNDRMHRYLIHHVLTKNGFAPEGVVFPISHVILEKIKAYREVLNSYSEPRLKYIRWRSTDKGNLEVLNNTLDLYRFFDATSQAEFLFQCVEETINTVFPNEIKYLKNHDEFKVFIESYIEMPDRLINLIIKFLEQGNGKFSKRAREREFEALTEEEIDTIQNMYQSIFL